MVLEWVWWKTERMHAHAQIGDFILSNNRADYRREGEMVATCCPCLLISQKPVTQQPGLINTYTVT
jgi:hypothetical protein